MDFALTFQPTFFDRASLAGNRQKIFYRSIREEKTKKLTPRASTVKKLEVVRTAAYEIFDRRVSDTDIWRSNLHNAHKIGTYWTHIPECEDRAICQGCEDLENLEHILLECECPGQKLIWKAAETLWLEKESHWPEVTLGTILGCGLAEFRDDRGKIKPGTQRLYRILMSESAYQIWRLRNERVIERDGEPASDDEIMNKWKFAMDKLLANRPRKGKRPALAPLLVLETWSGTLDNERCLPTNWLREPRVLYSKLYKSEGLPYC
ncbi:hypothetical protein B0H17DRAFT_1163744 [Mycena rosella]|uniref:Reverse transcriptase zinc-binding domain-containing protein n=1 Tax=Mycena rosella TaxID=1033263 RepID=A0AAD7CHZ4_MYCRO|nr:hypothetical protein B0H17DRAFT_1163744 [Mycena rosella]